MKYGLPSGLLLSVNATTVECQRKPGCLRITLTKQFYYWQRRVREEVFQELQPSLPSAVSFDELQPLVLDASQGGQPDAVLRIRYCTLDIRNTISPVLLQIIVQVMAHA